MNGDEIMGKEVFTTILYSKPSFLEGFARVVDFANALQEYNTSPTSEEADERAIVADWYAVGRDMYKAFQQAGIKRS